MTRRDATIVAVTLVAVVVFALVASRTGWLVVNPGARLHEALARWKGGAPPPPPENATAASVEAGRALPPPPGAPPLDGAPLRSAADFGVRPLGLLR